jgi:hypothetical protein
MLDRVSAGHIVGEKRVTQVIDKLEAHIHAAPVHPDAVVLFAWVLTQSQIDIVIKMQDSGFVTVLRDYLFD